MSQRTRKAKGKRADQPGQGSPNTMVMVLVGVGVLALAILAWNIISTATDETARAHVEIDYDSPAELLALAEPAGRGDPDAPIVMMDFSDYSCQFCAEFATRVKPTLMREYVDSGLMRFEYYDFPVENIFPNSVTAARAARCAGDQDGYWAYHDHLFQNQAQWSTQSDPVRTLEGYAEELGFDGDDFESCLRSDRHAEAVTANFRLGEQLGVGGTPTVMLNTGEGAPIRVNDWRQLPTVRGMIDDALERGGHLSADDPVDADDGDDAEGDGS